MVKTVDIASFMSFYILSFIYTYFTYSNPYPYVVRMIELTSRYDLIVDAYA